MQKILTPRLTGFLFIVVFLGALTLGPRMLNIDGDLPRHLLMGQVVLETGLAPTQEIFSYVYENQPYTPHEWLADVVYYAVYLSFGLNGVVFLASILIAATFTVIYSEAVSRNAKPLLTFFLVILGAVVSSLHWVTRPHLFTMLFLAVWLILIDRLYRGIQVKIWIFPAMMLFWANMHAEFIAGFLVLLAYLGGYFFGYLFGSPIAAARSGRDLLGITVLSFAASMLNPVGLRTWDVVVGYINNRYLLSRITETRPPDFTQGEYLPLLILLVTALVLLIARRNRFAPAHFFLLAGFGTMSLLSARNAHLSGVIFPLVLSGAFTGTTEFGFLGRIESAIRRTEGRSMGIMLPVLVLAVAALSLTGPIGTTNRFEPAVFPVDAVRWLEAHPQTGRMFNAFDWGGYILFHLWPDQKVFIESQTDVRGEVTRKYETVLLLQEGWQDIFKEYDITWAILPPDWPLTGELQKQGWRSVYQDRTAIILVMK